MRKTIAILMATLVVGLSACEVPEAEEETTGKQGASSQGKKKGGKAEAAKKDPSIVGNWKIENLKQVRFTEEYGMFASVDLRVRNVSDSADTPWFEIRLTDKKGDLVTEYDCIGDEYEPGQGGNVRCSSFDDYRPFANWEIKNSF